MLKKGYSIRSRIWLIVAVMVLLSLMNTFVFYCESKNVVDSNTRGVVRSVTQQTADYVGQITGEMRRVSNAMVSSDVLQRYYNASSALSKLEYANSISSFASSLIQYVESVSVINIVDLQGNNTIATRQSLSILDWLDEQGVFGAANRSAAFYGPLGDSYDGQQYWVYALPIFHTSTGKIHTKIGTCVTMSSTNSLSRYFQSVSASTHASFVLLSADGQPVVSFLEPGVGVGFPEDMLADVDGAVRRGFVSQDGVRYAVDACDLDIGGRLVCAIPYSQIINNTDPLIRLGLSGSIVILALVIFFCVRIHRDISFPVASLSRMLHGQGENQEQMPQHVPVNSPVHEIRELCEQFNHFLDQIEQMNQLNVENQLRMYKLRLDNKRAELFALQSQINPHFLYNTLDCLRGYGYLLDSKEIVQITNSLSRIMRYCIKGADMVSLEQEISIINSYLDIIHIRFEGRFQTSVQVDQALMDAVIPRFILQPVVENSVYHGLEPQLGSGRLIITGAPESPNVLLLTVEDDGVGIGEAALEKIHRMLANADNDNLFQVDDKQGLALVNIHRRITQSFSEEYGLSIESVQNEGTRVTLRMPYQRNTP